MVGAGLGSGIRDIVHWPFVPVLTRMGLAIAIGLFVGLEREHSGKAGVRTFALVAVLGCLGGLLGNGYALASLGFVALLVGFLNWRQLRLHSTLALTTSVALAVICYSGVLCGKGHVFTPVTAGILAAALLAWKEPISGFVSGLSEKELRSAILLAILTFVIYPVLPAKSVDPLDLVEPQSSWATVILIAAIGFVNYVLWKF